MKNTARIHSKGATKPAKSQRKTNTGTANKIKRLRLDWPTGDLFHRVNLSLDLAADILNSVKTTEITEITEINLDDWITDALQSKIHSLAKIPAKVQVKELEHQRKLKAAPIKGTLGFSQNHPVVISVGYDKRYKEIEGSEFLNLSNFDFPMEQLKAIARNAGSQGKSLDELFKPAMAALVNGLAEPEPVAAPVRVETPEFLTPSKVAMECADALALMDSTAKAATALLMMDAEKIRMGVKEERGWESLDVEGFGEGSLELARLVIGDFQTVFSDLRAGCQTMIARLRPVDQPVKWLGDVSMEHWNLVRKNYKLDSYLFENAVGALRHCIMNYGCILAMRPSPNPAHFTAFALDEKLQATERALAHAQAKLERAFLAVTVPAPASSAN